MTAIDGIGYLAASLVLAIGPPLAGLDPRLSG
jgi:hypothetical protein